MKKIFTPILTCFCVLTIGSALYAQGPGSVLEFQSPVNQSTGKNQHEHGDENSGLSLAPPSNDDCASAITLTAGAACISGTTLDATTQGGEYLCISPGGGITPQTAWYRFTATNDSMVLGLVLTNTTNCATVCAVFGPFAPGAGCLPGSGSQILCQNMGLIDPGFHPLLTGLTVGQDYLVQVQGNNCGGGNDRFANFCISIASPATNSRPGTASVVSSCGTAFSGTTAGGYWNNGTSVGSNNLDNNNATSVAGASELGDDVTFVINNVSWFTFCNGNASACDWSVNVSGISGCALAAPNDGVQAAVFTGTPAALTNVAMSPSRIATGGSWSSGSFSVGAGACAYIMVDGFAGDQCNYSLTLTNVSCPCTVFGIELLSLNGTSKRDRILLDWQMGNEDGISRYMIEKSQDGNHYTELTRLNKNMNATGSYTTADLNPSYGWNYYRLSALDASGNLTVLNTIVVMHNNGAARDLSTWISAEGLNWNLGASVAQTGNLLVTDVTGRTLVSTSLNVTEGTNTGLIPVQGWASGVYFLQINVNGEKIVSKVLIP